MKKSLILLICVVVLTTMFIEPANVISGGDGVQPLLPQGRWWGCWIGPYGGGGRSNAWTGSTSLVDWCVMAETTLYINGQLWDYFIKIRPTPYVLATIDFPVYGGPKHYENYSWHGWNGFWSETYYYDAYF